jgi:uracil-DNA glycosylase
MRPKKLAAERGADVSIAALRVLHAELDACRACPKMIGPVVHGPPVRSPVILVGQAPGPREGSFGKPFAWTAGRTMFRWFDEALGVDEATFRERIYMAAVARCFPGKASGGGDRRPDAVEIEHCKTWLQREADVLKPSLVIAVGTLAIEQVLAVKVPLAEIVGTCRKARWLGHHVEVIALPHPSGASPWHKMEPGKTLLGKALRRLGKHPAMRQALGRAMLSSKAS